jgi:hypothetical protein
LLSFTLKYDEGFLDDLQKIVDWYDSISTNVCNNFLEHLDFAQAKLKQNPHVFALVSNTRFAGLC